MQKHLKTIIYIGLFAIPFVPFLVSSSLFFPFITTKAFAWRIIVEVIFAAWALLALANAEYRPKRSFILYALLAFVAVIGVADIFGAAPMKSFWSNAERMEGYVTLLHLTMLYLVGSSFFRELDWRRWWQVSLGASALMSIYCIFQLLGVLEIHQGGARVDGTLGNAAYLAVYLLFHIFIAIYFWLRESGRGLKWLYGSLILLESLMLYFTATRGAILGLLGGLLVASVLSLRNREDNRLRRLGISYLVGFVVVIGLFFSLRHTSLVQGSPVLSRFANLSASEWKSEGRAFVWPMALKGVMEHPVLGWGQDNFNYVFNEHYSPEMYNLEPWFDRAHNIFLDWAIAGGLLGLIAYLSLYASLLYYLWRPASTFTKTERAVFTGLLAAYFFHNLFVFDHLISYILFIFFLAFVESASVTERFAGKMVSEDSTKSMAAPLAGILLLALLYFVNIRPIITNTTIISALRDMQSGNPTASMNEFRKAYGESRLGRPEVVEQMAANSPALLASNATLEEKNSFYNFARTAVEGQAAEVPDDARYQMLAGDFLTRTGQYAAGEAYLKRAIEEMPDKQVIYFELASSQINRGDYQGALATLKHAYDLAPGYYQAKSAYLVGAIYAGDMALEQKLLAEMPAQEFINDAQVLSAMYQHKQYSLLISTFRNIENKFPNLAPQAETYIQQIQNATK
ncbi:O-antigen ligase family protein [Candidatus Parcubacteria bacterium]|nr:O-antigen ligase family protein [Candidatus Parcubacteria bacterium]